MKRPWGEWKVLLKGDGYKVKELIVNPKKSLSLQRHEHRDEHWVFVSGDGHVSINFLPPTKIRENFSIFVPRGMWHQLSNKGRKPIRVIEVSTGKILEESDIERME